MFVLLRYRDINETEDMGDRDFRFEKIREKLPEPLAPETFAMETEEVPDYFTRMQSVIKSLNESNPEFKPVLMDTKFASLAGVCYDKEVEKLNSFIVMDIGLYYFIIETLTKRQNLIVLMEIMDFIVLVVLNL